jgi:hypothetical protein
VHRAVLPAAVPDRATDFLGLKPGVVVDVSGVALMV